MVINDIEIEIKDPSLCKQNGCNNQGDDKMGNRCKKCTELYKDAIEIALLVNKNSNQQMTLHDMKELFRQIIEPMLQDKQQGFDDLTEYFGKKESAESQENGE